MRATAVIVITGFSLLLAGCAAAKSTGPPAGAGQPRSTVAGQLPAGSVRELAALIASRIKSADNPVTSPGSVIKYQDQEYYAAISNARTPQAFTAFATATRDIAIQPSSSARVNVVSYSPARLVTSSERARWQAAGRPPMPQVAVTGQAFSIPAGSFSFIPQGMPLTYR